MSNNTPHEPKLPVRVVDYKTYREYYTPLLLDRRLYLRHNSIVYFIDGNRILTVLGFRQEVPIIQFYQFSNGMFVPLSFQDELQANFFAVRMLQLLKTKDVPYIPL